MSTDPNNSNGQIRASIREVLLAVRQMIVSGTGLDDASVFITREQNKMIAVAEKSVAIWVGGESPDGVAVVGGGRVNEMRLRTARLIIRTRTRLDESDRDTESVSNYSLGSITLEDAVVDALDVLSPTNNQDQIIVSHPLIIGPIGDPQSDPQNTDFTRSIIELRIPYVRALNQDLPNEGTMNPPPPP